jgi:hypothetical protein
MAAAARSITRLIVEGDYKRLMMRYEICASEGSGGRCSVVRCVCSRLHLCYMLTVLSSKRSRKSVEVVTAEIVLNVAWRHVDILISQ